VDNTDGFCPLQVEQRWPVINSSLVTSNIKYIKGAFKNDFGSSVDLLNVVNSCYTVWLTSVSHKNVQNA